MIIDFLGRILAFTGPHLGNIFDGHAFIYGYDLHPVRIGEYLLGDGHYAWLPWIISPYPEQPNGVLSKQEYITNAIISHYRSRIEHVIGRIKRHMIFKTAFRGTLDLLSDLMTICMHTQNVYQMMYPSYAFYGPWGHFPQ